MARFKIAGFAANIASFSLVATILFFAYIILVPITILENWQLGLTADKYALGQSLIITSTYTKTIDATGISSRYLECKDPAGVYVTYRLSDAAANHKSGPGGTGILVTIPQNIVELTIPTSCHFRITIDYKVFVIRTITEQNTSKDFTLYRTLPIAGQPTDSQIPAVQSQPTPASSIPTSPTDGNAISPQSSTTPSTSPSATPVPVPEPTCQVNIPTPFGTLRALCSKAAS